MKKFLKFLRSLFGPTTVEIVWEAPASEVVAREPEPEPVKFEKPKPNSVTKPKTTVNPKPKAPVKKSPVKAKTTVVADKPKKKSYYKPKVKA